MNTLIVYAGKSGTTKKMATFLRDSLEGEVTLANLRKNRAPDPAAYDRVLIGGAVYAGSLDKVVRRFCEKYLESLKNRKIGLFLCSLREEDADGNFARNFPPELRTHASSERWLGGRFIFAEHTFVIRAMMKKLTGKDTNVDNLQWDKAKQFVDEVS